MRGPPPFPTIRSLQIFGRGQASSDQEEISCATTEMLHGMVMLMTFSRGTTLVVRCPGKMEDTSSRFKRSGWESRDQKQVILGKLRTAWDKVKGTVISALCSLNDLGILGWSEEQIYQLFNQRSNVLSLLHLSSSTNFRTLFHDRSRKFSSYIATTAPGLLISRCLGRVAFRGGNEYATEVKLLPQ